VQLAAVGPHCLSPERGGERIENRNGERIENGKRVARRGRTGSIRAVHVKSRVKW
jgi:hypothetical protein